MYYIIIIIINNDQFILEDASSTVMRKNFYDWQPPSIHMEGLHHSCLFIYFCPKSLSKDCIPELFESLNPPLEPPPPEKQDTDRLHNLSITCMDIFDKQSYLCAKKTTYS